MKKWDQNTIAELYEMPFFELINRAYSVHTENFSNASMELCTLLSIKTGGCPEDCGYCPQSAHYKTGLKREKLLDVDAVLAEAQRAKSCGAKRFCMGAAWKSPPKGEFPKVLEMVKQVKAMGLETCVTLGMLDQDQAEHLKEAGLDFYNHNLDTSPEHYQKIVSTRTYEDRLNTLDRVREAGINVCCGGIIGMGESRQDRINFLWQLTQLSSPPESVPINKLIPVGGTPLAQTKPVDNFEFIRTIAVARIILPTSVIRLSAGREDMSDEMQAWCFMAGSNSIFYGDVLLTAENPSQDHDLQLLQKLGIKPSSELTQAAVSL